MSINNGHVGQVVSSLEMQPPVACKKIVLGELYVSNYDPFVVALYGTNISFTDALHSMVKL